MFTRSDGSPVKDFRGVWAKACVAAGVGQTICKACGAGIPSFCQCSKGEKRPVYRGLIFHDLRRTAARNLRRAGVAEGVIMKIGGWKTRSVFERYAIVAQSDIADAVQKLQKMHSFNHSEAVPMDSAEKTLSAN